MSTITGSTSDGYHTFDELYHHRTVLFAMLAATVQAAPLHGRARPWKSRAHEDGTMFDGYFIAGITTSNGQATYHCRAEYWGLFDVPELDRAPEFDGHTPNDTLARLVLSITGSELDVTA